jgi:shikimate kinase
MKRHILLVGLPGCGKTTVGRIVAERLGTGLIDSDLIIVRKMQMPIARIFGVHGEARFRELERETMAHALEGPPSVLAPGGGWAVQPGQMEQAKTNSYVVYLKTMAMTATKRATIESTRPMLVGEDSAGLMRDLLKEREATYMLADAEIKNDSKTPEAAADEIVALAKQHAGW